MCKCMKCFFLIIIDFYSDDIFAFIVSAYGLNFFAYKFKMYLFELLTTFICLDKGDEIVDKDEHPRPETTLEGLAKLPAVFKKNGTVTAGSASVTYSLCKLLLYLLLH